MANEVEDAVVGGAAEKVVEDLRIITATTRIDKANNNTVEDDAVGVVEMEIEAALNTFLHNHRASLPERYKINLPFRQRQRP
jgi:hypothetical protein